MTPGEAVRLDNACRKARRRLAGVTLLRAMGGAPRPFWAPCGGALDRFTVAVHRDTYEATVGKWRVTVFDGSGPVTHDVHESWAAAVDHAGTAWRAVLCLAQCLKAA